MSNSATQPDDPPTAGHNELSDLQRQALLIQGVVKIERLQEQMETIKADIRNTRKALKSEGFVRFEVDYALRLRKVDETEEMDRRRREARIARWLNHPIGTQTDLFDDEYTDRTPAVDKAFEDGRIAGMAGEKCEPPYVGGEQSNRWIEGWHEGQAVLASEGFSPLSDAIEEDAA